MIHVAGTGSFAADIAEVARDAGHEIAGLIELDLAASAQREIATPQFTRQALGLPPRLSPRPQAGRDQPVQRPHEG